jgi:hypothetical protein
MPENLRLRLGELLTAGGLLDPAVLREALDRQHSRRLGEVLVEMGVLAPEELPVLLELQTELRQADPGRAREVLAARLRIGELLLRAGIIDRAALEAALANSRTSGRRIGETLVESGALSRRVLERFLGLQRRLSAVALAGLAACAAAHPSAALAADARVEIRASVADRAFIERQQVPQRVAVSEEDVARGYVDVESPIELRIRSNHVAGVALAFALNSPLLSAVDLRFAEGGEIRAGEVHVAQSGRGMRSVDVSVQIRLHLTGDAVPGTIAFPFTPVLTPR